LQRKVNTLRKIAVEVDSGLLEFSWELQRNQPMKPIQPKGI